ncbi:hypothetical protein AB0L00_44790 [Actinoallomurus sp. NPDC052308]|uniref:RNA polymerase sigma factor n=1 Tax=Actinoallomurus sp. NPDC052308 TaxID=3155530 RepID=UPI003431E29E
MVTWQGDAPAPRLGDHASSQEEDDTESERCADLDLLPEAATLIDQAEAELAPDVPPDECDLESRLAVDQLLVEAVLEQGLNGSRHQRLNAELIRYAVPVLRYLLRTGQIVAKCVKLRRWYGDADALPELSDADHDDLAQQMVADALPVFTTAVFVERRWSPARGASLKTYFVNACALQFPTLYRRWLRDRSTVRPIGLVIDPDRPGGAVDPAVQVAMADEVERLLGEIKDQQVREVLVLRAAGFSASQAAEAVGLTPKAAEGRTARVRKQISRRSERPPAADDDERRERGRFL